MDFLNRNDRVRWFRWSLLAGLVVVAAAILVAVFRPELVSGEAGIYEEIARQLIDNTTVGRQAVISSMWWPPFCTLTRLPLVFLFPDDGFPWASIAVSGLSGLFIVSLLWRNTCTLAGKVRAVIICLLLVCSPFFARGLVSGSSQLLIALMVVVAGDSLAQWLVGRRVRSLVYFAVSSSLIVGLSSELTVWLVLMMVIFVVDALKSRSMSVKHKEAVLLLGLLPALYTLGLWVLMNWLIMGDPLYFVKSLWRVRPLAAARGEGMAELNMLHFVCGLIPAFTAGISAGSRNRAGVLWSLFAVLLFVSIVAFHHLGMLWSDTHILGVLPIFVFFTSVASMGHIQREQVIGWRKLLIALPAIVVCLSFAMGSLSDTDGSPAVNDASYLPAIERHVMARTRYGKVFVCGYDSFGLLHGRNTDTFVHALDFNFNKAKNDYRGHDLFVMVKRPSGRGSGDSIHWKYLDIYMLGSDETLYDADWGGWRMFEVIQAPDEERLK